MHTKIQRVFSHSPAEIKERVYGKLSGFLFSSIKPFFMSERIAISYLPDSICHFNAYPYIRILYNRFIKYNKQNNGGDFFRLISFILNIDKVVNEDKIEGDFAEVGVWKGNTASVLAYYAESCNRMCYLFDTFEGFHKKDLVNTDENSPEGLFSDTSVDIVKKVIGDTSIKNCTFIKGYFPDSLPETITDKKFSVVSLDADLYQPVHAGLEWFYPRMDTGALFLLHDYSSRYWEGCKRAIDEFCKKYHQNVVLLPDKSGSAFVRIQK